MRTQCVRSAGMAFLLAFLAASAQAGDALFSPMELRTAHGSSLSLDTSFQALLDNPATASLQLVRANPDVLQERTATLTLSLAQGLDVKAHRVDSYRSNTGSLIWSGVIEDPSSVIVPLTAESLQFDPIHSVMLVKNGDKITGNVHFGGEWYKIRPLRTGGHAVIAVDMSAMPPDHPAEYGQLRSYAMKGSPPALAAPAIAADTVIRVMVHYTSSAAAASGDINGLIDLAVAESNQGYTNGGVLIDLILAHKSQVTYTQSGSFSTDLSRYRGTSDGYMDSIHTTRNSVAADVALLVINNSSSCGLASSIGSTASTAFADAHWDCITGYYSFAHEIGHLQSARHDPATDPTTTPYAYGHGYRYNGSPKWRTIMAYNCTGGGCPRLNYWSNPNKLYNGVPMGTVSQSDNTRVLNNTRNTVAAFR
ncbi:MAG TPA: M12 family metallo-peptidase [Thermoanaerobaculia bacterium]|nr:M12 family metallo-peptidase [Thermoanaerobaculia bacterium]